MPEEKIDRGILKYKFKAEKAEGRHTIAQYLVNEYSIKTIDSREREIFIFRGGYYIPAINFLSGEIEDILGSLSGTNVKNEIINKVRDMTLCKRDIFEVPLNLINLENGVYDLTTKELLPHDPKYAFLHKLPINFNPEATCPLIEKFLGEILTSEDINIIQEFFGFALYRKYFIKKAIILIGERDTGKTTLLTLISHFIGRENISGVSLQKIGTDKFATVNLYQKHLNAYDDLSFRDIGENGSFKMATGGGMIPGEHKFGSQFLFENYAKLIFTANKVPIAKDNDDVAYYSRWIILQFKNVAENPDPMLIDKLTTPEELSGLFNYGLKGLENLLKSFKFSYAKEPFEIKREMQLSGSPIAGFVQTRLEQEEGEWISKEDMFRIFAQYVKDNELQAMTMEKFGRELMNYASFIYDSRGTNVMTGKQARGWRGAKIKDENNSMDEVDNSFEEYGEIISASN